MADHGFGLLVTMRPRCRIAQRRACSSAA
jgi:hypothetical protein